MFYVYILYSKKSGIYNIGSTDDVERRFLEINKLAENSFTSVHRPGNLLQNFSWNFERIGIKIERHTKKQKSRRYIEEIFKRGSVSE